MKPITSASNPKLKRAVRLHDSRGRKKQGRIIIFGDAEISRALESNVHIDEYFLLENGGEKPQTSIMSHSADKFVLPKALFQKLSFGQRGDGIVAVARRPDTSLSRLSKKHTLVLVLEAIEKPGNIGAVFRSSAAAGVDAIVLADPICDVYHPNAIRASIGSVFSIPIGCADVVECQSWLCDNDFQVVTTRVDAKCEFTEFDLTRKTAIVLGNEANGVSAKWNSGNSKSVTIPMQESIDSLNVAMSATLLAYEAKRQRNNASI